MRSLMLAALVLATSTPALAWEPVFEADVGLGVVFLPQPVVLAVDVQLGVQGLAMTENLGVGARIQLNGMGKFAGGPVGRAQVAVGKLTYTADLEPLVGFTTRGRFVPGLDEAYGAFEPVLGVRVAVGANIDWLRTSGSVQWDTSATEVVIAFGITY